MFFLMTNMFTQEIISSSNAPPSTLPCFQKNIARIEFPSGLFIPTKVNLAEDGIFLHPVHATTCPLRVSSLRVPSREGWDHRFHT